MMVAICNTLANNGPKNKVIPKHPRWSRKKGDDITTQALGYGVGNYTRGLVKNIMFEVG